MAVNSGTSALEIVLKAIGIKSNDEVIVPTQTFVSTASCVLNNGGRPVFCEIDSNHLIDFDDFKRKITKKTKAVIVVHFCGLIHPKIKRIKKFCDEKNIILIEDSAHAHGAKINDISAGNIGDFGCFSFFSTKIMTTGGEGGFITTNDSKYYEKCKSISSIGIDLSSRVELYSFSGSNMRMSEIQAIIGISQLNEVENFIDHRIKIANLYKTRLEPSSKKGLVAFQDFPENIRHPYWKFIIFLNGNIKREVIQLNLKKNGIGIDWPYNPLLHLQPLFKNMYGTKQGSMKTSEDYASNHICLPIHKNIDSKAVDYICTQLIKCL